MRSMLITYALKSVLSLKLPIIFFLFTLFILLFFAKPSFAQNTTSPSSNEVTTGAVNYPLLTQNLPPQSPHLTSLAFYNLSHAISCVILGQSPVAPCLEYKFVQDATGSVKAIPYLSSINTGNGILGTSVSMVAIVISTPPIRSSEFLANFGDQIGIKSAHAQVVGSGSGVLAPIFKLWEVSRNIAYLAMIMIFVFVGLMVMFRQKLNPQTVVSVQMALPGLIIGLVMITFSYFLASLISDLAFVGTNIVGYYFALAQGGTGLTQTPLVTTTGEEQNVLNIFTRYTGILDEGAVGDALHTVWDNISDGNARLLTTLSAAFVYQISSQVFSVANIIPFAGEGIKQFLSAGAGIKTLNDPRGMVGLALSWIAGIILIYSMFRLLMKLISNLLNIIFLTITAPFQFLAASIPGKQGLLTKWFFNMLCNVLAFPAVVGVFYFVAFILGVTDPALPLGGGKAASVVNTSTFPLLGGLDLKILNLLLAFGALIALPSIPDAICKSVGKPGAFAGVLGGAIGAGIASGQKYSGQIGQGAANVGERGGNLYTRSGYTTVTTDNKADFPGKGVGDIVKTSDPRYGAQWGGIAKLYVAMGKNPPKAPTLGQAWGGVKAGGRRAAGVGRALAGRVRRGP